MVCKQHGTEYIKDIGKGKNKRKRCNKCLVESVTRCRQNLKKRLVEHFGGECTKCGYSKSINALEFHHEDPKQKSFGISTNKTTRSYAKLLAEAEKCNLICANCHRELHY